MLLCLFLQPLLKHVLPEEHLDDIGGGGLTLTHGELGPK